MLILGKQTLKKYLFIKMFFDVQKIKKKLTSKVIYLPFFEIFPLKFFLLRIIHQKNVNNNKFLRISELFIIFLPIKFSYI